MKEQTILLVEDNFLNRRLIKKVLTERGYHILESKNSVEALDILEKRKVHLIILDINLGETEMDGISLGQIIKDKFATPFIYLTAYETSDIIHRAVDTKPCSYITKPFKNVDLVVSVEIALQQNEQKDEHNVHYLLVKDNEYNIKLAIADIDYFESEGNYLLVHSGKKCYKYRSTIKQVIDILPKDIFAQVHRAFIVNKNKIDKYSPKDIIIGEMEVPLSRKYMDNFREEL